MFPLANVSSYKVSFAHLSSHWTFNVFRITMNSIFAEGTKMWSSIRMSSLVFQLVPPSAPSHTHNTCLYLPHFFPTIQAQVISANKKHCLGNNYLKKKRNHPILTLKKKLVIESRIYLQNWLKIVKFCNSNSYNITEYTTIYRFQGCSLETQ